MTVKELIEILEEMPQEAEVYYHCGDNGWTEPDPEYGEWSEAVYGIGDDKWIGVAL